MSVNVLTTWAEKIHKLFLVREKIVKLTFFCRSLFPSALFLLEKFAQKVRARTQSSREKSSRENCVNSVKSSREKSSREN